MGTLSGVGRLPWPDGGSSADTSAISTNLRNNILLRAVVDKLAPGLYGPGWWSLVGSRVGGVLVTGGGGGLGGCGQ